MADIPVLASAPAEVRHEDPDGQRTYPYPDGSTPPALLWSVTTIISATDSKPWLRGWYSRKSTEFCVDNIDLLARVRVTKGRQAAIDLGKDEARHRYELKADVGTYVHDVKEALILWAHSPGRTGADISIPDIPPHLVSALYDMGNDEYLPVPVVADFMITGFFNFVTDFKPRFLATEMPVYNLDEGIAGTLDSIMVLPGIGIAPDGKTPVANPGGELVIDEDTKTGQLEGTWKEQLAAYRRMTECRPSPLSGLRPKPATDAGAVLHLRPEYPRGYSLTLVAGADDQAAWDRFRRAFSTFTERQEVKSKPGIVIRPLRTDGTMTGLRLCDMYAEGLGRALSPLTKALGGEAELAEIAEFTADELLAIKGIGPKLIDLTRSMLAAHGLHLAGEDAPLGKAA
jgi:hypothetical protein